MLRVARQERPGVLCQLVALDYRDADAAARLAADQGSAQADADVRHAGRPAAVRQWQERLLPPPRRPGRMAASI